MSYACVILDEAHRARRRNLGESRDDESPQPNNLLSFMYRIAQRTRSLLLATATPVQMRPVEVWDLLDILSRGDDGVLGNMFARWRHASRALSLVMGQTDLPTDISEQWEWVRNPMPPKGEHRDFQILRRRLDADDDQAVISGSGLDRLGPPDRSRLSDMFPRFVTEHNPFIQRVVRRTREQLENQIDPETNEPLLQKVRVELLGENERDAIRLPPYLHEAYELAEKFCEKLGARMKASGFLRTLLLRRVGSSIYAGLCTAQRMLSQWEQIDVDEDEDEELSEDSAAISGEEMSRTLTAEEGELLQRFVDALEANQERDPKYTVVRQCLLERGWLQLGCIVFSQYRDSIQWLAEQLTEELPKEPIALYSGPMTSGIMQDGAWTLKSREDLKKMVMRGEIRLMLGTDAASEGLNLQRLARLINLDLPWNPTKLEQRKGRIQRIGQIHETVQVYNIRYKDSVEDRVHQLLSQRLEGIYNLFGQIPDVLEDVWIAVALGEREQAKKIIDELPRSHPFELRYTRVETIDWESCSQVLDAAEKTRILKQGW
jgi:hypothetical protein